MNEKIKLLEFIENPVETTAKNIMCCSENWYNPYWAIMKTFSKKDIEDMSDTEVENLVKLADNISEGLY